MLWASVGCCARIISKLGPQGLNNTGCRKCLGTVLILKPFFTSCWEILVMNTEICKDFVRKDILPNVALPQCTTPPLPMAVL